MIFIEAVIYMIFLKLKKIQKTFQFKRKAYKRDKLSRLK